VLPEEVAKLILVVVSVAEYGAIEAGEEQKTEIALM